jgi:hypothetical protein
MSMSAALRDRLKDAGVAGGAVYRDERVQDSGLPAVRMVVVSDPRDSDYDGRIATRETRVQLDCMATSRGQADEIAEAAINAAEPEGTAGDTRFIRAFIDSSRSYSERDNANVLTFVTSLDLRVWHKPAA